MPQVGERLNVFRDQSGLITVSVFPLKQQMRNSTFTILALEFQAISSVLEAVALLLNIRMARC